MQCKGVEFVKQIVSKFPNLRRPALRNPRFDHKILKLIPAKPGRDQQQPLLVDPQANNSAGEVEIQIGDIPQSLERNNGSQTQNQVVPNKRRDGKAPFQKIKRGQ